MPTTALLIIDMQNDFLHEKGTSAKYHVDAHVLADSVAILSQAATQWAWALYQLRLEEGTTNLHIQFQVAGIQRVVLCGVGTHVGVTILAKSFLNLCYQVDVVEDATTAGSLPKHLSALKTLQAAGAKIISCGDVLQEGPLKLTGFGAHTVLYSGQEGFAKGDFEVLYQEIQWHTMFHRGGEVPRRVALQGTLGPTGEEPLYRHPADEQPPLQPWTPGVDRLRRAAEKLAEHPLNHGLLQLYRDGRDWIGAHSDKTLDVMPNTFIVNVSLGATRSMVLRPKETGHPQRIVLPNASVLLMDLETNRRWFHEIRQQGAAGEIGPRISLTFRYIGSFWHPQSQAIWGTGTPYADASQFVAPSRAEVLEESDRMLRLFREENQDPNFDVGQYQPGFRIPNLQVWREVTGN